MSYLPQYKIHDCDFCENKDCPSRKVKTEYYCLAKCYPDLKRNEQLKKHKSRQQLQREKGQLRPLIGSVGNREMAEKNKVAEAELGLWFMVKMKISPRKCENCGKDLSGLNDTDWKGSQHHILEKSIYKSVRTHPENHLVLGRWCCHPQFHTSMLNASKMPIFPEANRKVVEMLPLLKPEEIRRISEYYIIPT